MTGVNNRRAYDEQSAKEFAKCQRTERPFSLLVTDIDFFKRFNDDYGHKVGDDALKHVASLMAESLRTYDNLYRYGGEEFVVVLSECNLVQAKAIAERLRVAIADSPLQVEDKKVGVTISIGIASNESQVGALAELFEAADKCLYKAKENGRNCCVALESNATAVSGYRGRNANRLEERICQINALTGDSIVR